MLKSIVPLSAIISLRFFGLFIVLPVISVYAMQLHGATTTLVGIVVGGYALTQMIFQIPFGIMSDKLGRKGTIVLGFKGNNFFAKGRYNETTEIYAQKLIEVITQQIHDLQQRNTIIPYFFLCATKKNELQALTKYLSKKNSLLSNYVKIAKDVKSSIISKLISGQEKNNDIGKIVADNAGDERQIGGHGALNRDTGEEEHHWLITTLHKNASYDCNRAIYGKNNIYTELPRLALSEKATNLELNEINEASNALSLSREAVYNKNQKSTRKPTGLILLDIAAGLILTIMGSLEKKWNFFHLGANKTKALLQITGFTMLGIGCLAVIAIGILRCRHIIKSSNDESLSLRQ